MSVDPYEVFVVSRELFSILNKINAGTKEEKLIGLAVYLIGLDDGCCQEKSVFL